MFRSLHVIAICCLGLAACDVSLSASAEMPATGAAPGAQASYMPEENCRRDRRIGSVGSRVVSVDAEPGRPGTLRFRDAFNTIHICFVDGAGQVAYVSTRTNFM